MSEDTGAPVALAVCRRCGTPAVPGTTKCERHTEADRRRWRRRYQRHRERAQALRATPEYRIKNAARMRATAQRYREQGVCIKCGAPRAETGMMCEKHREMNRANARASLRKRRARQWEGA